MFATLLSDPFPWVPAPDSRIPSTFPGFRAIARREVGWKSPCRSFAYGMPDEPIADESFADAAATEPADAEAPPAVH